jgi:hypothetical protein
MAFHQSGPDRQLVLVVIRVVVPGHRDDVLAIRDLKPSMHI